MTSWYDELFPKDLVKYLSEKYSEEEIKEFMERDRDVDEKIEKENMEEDALEFKKLTTEEETEYKLRLFNYYVGFVPRNISKEELIDKLVDSITKYKNAIN